MIYEIFSYEILQFHAMAGVPNIWIEKHDDMDILPPLKDIHASAEDAERKSVCISGSLPSGRKKADYEAPLKTAGYELVDEVRKGMTYLVLADTD